MNITNEAKEMLEAVLKERGREGIRIFSVSSGCCGPQFGVSLDAPEAEDVVKSVNGIQVAIDPTISNDVEQFTLDKEASPEGDRLVMLGMNSCC